MSERRLLAFIAILFGFLGVVLVLIQFHLPRGDQDFLAWLQDVGVWSVLALIALLALVLIYGRQQRAGGALNVIVGVALLIVGPSLWGSLVIVFSGILGLVAGGTFDENRTYRQ
jgi:hypothetical protein